ncbi:MAG: DUF2804 domain-containing protein [Erysipelotrichaceae bacterium]|nr:DUF2804 domain-containing protein [Erysipelotrichaceae bacterium]
MQHEIRESHLLLDENNNIIEPGYAKRMLPVYNKKTDLRTRFHTKEWDYYYIGNQHYGLALTIADNGYMGLDSVSILNFDDRFFVTRSQMQAMTLGKKNFPATSEKGDVKSASSKCVISFENDGKTRHLSGFLNNFIADTPIEFDLTLTDFPEESMVICTPFEKPGHFYFNQKINCMKAEGWARTGQKEYLFNKADSLATLDWGRGIWTYSNTWYWSSLQCYLGEHRFGFNLGYGFGDTSAASENMLFYDGKSHKLEEVTFHIPTDNKGRDLFVEPWTFTSSDDRVNLTFKPIFDRADNTNVLIIQSNQHQVFGRFYGTCILDDGTEIKLDGQMGFAEKVANRW